MSKEGGAAIISRRDNFSTSVTNILARRAGGKCSMCKRATFGPNDDPHKAICIGQAAHISAAAPDGPRYDPKMTVEERTSAKNGLWLCSNCHLLIDRNPKEYPIERLNAIKREAEEGAKQEIHDGFSNSQVHINYRARSGLYIVRPIYNHSRATHVCLMNLQTRWLPV